MGKSIVKCRLCGSKRLKYALKLEGHKYVVCQLCTLLQREQETTRMTIELGETLSVDYYPYFLSRKEFPEIKDVYFSLKAVEVLLQKQGLQVTQAQTTDEGKLEVTFEPMSNLDKIRMYELSKKLDNQYTYFLYEVSKK